MLAILFVMFIDNFGISLGFGALGPLILSPEYGFLEGASPNTRSMAIGFLFAAYPLMQFFFAPLVGDIADKYGRKKAFLLTLSGLIVGFLLTAVAIMMKSFTFLLIMRIISGAFSANLAICLAALSDMHRDEASRSRAFGFNSTAMGLGWVCAMLIGGYLLNFSPSLAFWITALLTLGAFLGIILFFKETHTPNAPEKFSLLKGVSDVKEALNIPSVRPSYIAYFLFAAGWGGMVSWIPEVGIQVYKVTVIATTWVMVANGIGWSIGGLWINPVLSKRIGNSRYSILSMLALIFFMTLLSIPTNFFLIGVFMLLGACVAALAMTNILNMMSLQAPEDIQGRVMGLAQSGFSLGLTVGPIIGAQMFAYSPPWAFPVETLLVVIGLFFLLLGMRRATPLSLKK